MTDDEVATFLRESHKLQLGTSNPDGTLHIVPMFYNLIDGRIVFWTYGKAQKARNIERDPRVSCVVETGEDYSELRGVLIYGTAGVISEPETILDIGTKIMARTMDIAENEHGDLRAYVEHTGRKRIAYVVEPTRVISWDHRKIDAAATA